MMPTIDELIEQGYRVKISHYRRATTVIWAYDGQYYNFGQAKRVPGYYSTHQIKSSDYLDFDSKGGFTKVEVTKGNVGIVGIARCNDVDHYDKRFGVLLALARAFDDIETVNALVDSVYNVTD